MRTFLLLVLVLALPAAERWRVDPDASSVHFSGSSSLHRFRGAARITAGVVDLDPAHPAGYVEIDARSMDTDGAKRDQRMHAEVMRSAEFPTVRFDLRALEARPDGLLAHGTWTMRGVSREVVVPVHLARGRDARASARFSLDIRRWDIDPPRVMVVVVDPEVEVEISLHLVADPSAAAPRIDRGLSGVVANDEHGGAIDVAAAVAARTVIVYDAAGAADAATWCQRLNEAQRPHLSIREGAALVDAKPRDGERANMHPGAALVDASGEVATRLRLPRARVHALVFDADGQLIDEVIGPPKPELFARALRLGGVEPVLAADGPAAH